jgi:hypothetical protein
MIGTRRTFVIGLASAAGSLAARDEACFAQFPPTPPPPPEPAETRNPAEARADPRAAAGARRAALQQNAKEFREGVERLYKLAADLHEEVQKTTTIDVLSLRMVKKTEEIERLAKQLKNKAKGG